MRKFHFGTQMGFMGGMLFCLIESVIFNIAILRHFGLTGIIYAFILLVIFFFIQKVKYLILVKELGLLAIVFYFTYHTGGLLTCGGIILVGIVPVLVSLSFKNYRQIIPVFSTYFVSVIYLAIADKQLPGKELIPPNWNLVLFASTLLACTFVFFVFALLAQRIYTNLEHRETERQKEINDAKTRLYTNITHEFRTPLTVILGLADSTKNNGQTDFPSKMDTIIKNGKNLLQLVDQMLDLSKLESGRMSVNKIGANIIPFLKYVFQLQEFYAEEKNISMKFSSESQSHEIEFDPEKLASIVSNLISNAIKFTPDDGQINMKVYRNDENICIEIMDNGIGIPPEKQETIFDRFYQVDSKTTRKEGGAGIGLAITRELVHLLNGTIELRSHPDVGTAFTVKLPYIAASEKPVTVINKGLEPDSNGDAEAETQLPLEVGNHQRLLIVEDNADVVGYLKACYQNHFSIQTAKNGNEGFLFAVEEIPDIIISDVMMPGMDGFELCQKLKDDYRTSHIPIILLTAKADIPSRIEGLETGADAYIVKPFNQRELLVRMQKLLELRRKLFQRYSHETNLELSPDPILQKEDQFIQKINETIRNNLGDEFFNIQVLCSEMAMSKSQLYRKFKALTNQSAAKHIRTLRMKKAKDLLQTTSMNITEVGYEVGMKSVSAFSQVFKEEFGQSPSEFAHHMADNQ
ncbi:hybrid sensor histidine kinase/response regulator transcription factor [Mangrovibacterium lignilyticum]|uniref:hybrid sensor histidine kinase/response regulator transcription factor n=1 Tax=Mangrovibacterium lignilyticum TaxID=2668052 RepID=UPI0013D39DD3|nr:ATP-binding protein [Mangrovibacterium lignilyticum]